MSFIRYRDGYRYQLFEDYCVALSIRLKLDIRTEYICLSTSGLLTIFRGYAWDGPSGPTIDTKNFMRGSLIHDALYQLMRGNYLELSYREAADRELRTACLEDGMSQIRAWWVYNGVRMFGEPCAAPRNDEVLIAP